VSKGVIEYLFHEAKHPELIDRSFDILKEFAINGILDQNIIDLLWSKC